MARGCETCGGIYVHYGMCPRIPAESEAGRERDRKIGALNAAILSARARASKVGPQHALWDVIADAEALLAGKCTLGDWGPRSSAFDRLTQALS